MPSSQLDLKLLSRVHFSSIFAPSQRSGYGVLDPGPLLTHRDLSRAPGSLGASSPLNVKKTLKLSLLKNVTVFLTLGNADQKKETASESSMIGQYARKSVHTLRIKTSGDPQGRSGLGCPPQASEPLPHLLLSLLPRRILKERSDLLQGPSEP